MTALTGVAEDEDVAVGLVVVSAVEVDENVGSVSVFSNIEAVGIGLTGVIEGVQIGDR